MRTTIPTIQLLRIVASLAVLLVFTSCGGGSSTPVPLPQPSSTAFPTIASVSPSSIPAGGPAFTLTVNGTNFVSNSTVMWNGNARPTTFVSSAQLQAAITAADIANPVSINISVSTPGSGGSLTSSNFAFTITQLVSTAPAITSLSPGNIIAGGPAFALIVNGTNFVSGSTVLWNGSARPTTFLFGNQLQAAITAADIANSGNINVAVSNPASGGTVNSSNFPFSVISNSVLGPSVTGLAPTAAIFDHPGFTIKVFGTNFLPGATVLWNGSARTSTFVATTRLDATITAADIATPATAMVTVSNPGGILSSNSLPFDIRPNPIPQISFTFPGKVIVGGPGFKLSAVSPFCNPDGLEPGCYVPSSVVLWNGSQRPTTFLDPGALQIDVSAADVSTIGQAIIQVVTPAPGGGTSNSVPFLITPHPFPNIVGFMPATVTAGGPGFKLNLLGTGLESVSVVKWNGSVRTATFDPISGGLSIDVTATDIATPGAATVNATNPPPGGGTSLDAFFPIAQPTTLVNQTAKDIIYDPSQKVLYLSVPSGAAANPNTITVVNPADGSILNSVAAAGSDPHVLAISDDSSFLYAGIDGTHAVQRFVLPGLTPDISYTLASSPTVGPSYALDLKVSPGAPHTSAVTLGSIGAGTAANLGVYIYDDATQRPVIAPGFTSGGGLYDSLAWSANAATLFAANNESNSFDLYTLSVDANGVTQNKDFANAFFRFVNKIHFDPVTKILFSDDGPVADATGVLGRITASGPMAADGALNAAFFILPSNIDGTTYIIRKYDLNVFSLADSITVTGVAGTPLRLIRWGDHGLAFVTNAGKVYVFSSPTFVK